MFRWLVNVVLLAFPIITTIAILIGLQSASDEPILPDNGVVGGGGGSGGGGKKGDNTLKKYFECNATVGIHPPTDGQGYTLNPNPWGWEEGSPGSICVDVLGFNNGSYPTDKTAPEFWITWQYPQDNPNLPVHAFANIMIEDKKVLPVALSDISKLSLDLEWTYTVGNSSWNATEATNEAELTENDTNTNVAIDMFLHSDKTKAVTPSTAAYEVMVWFATFGPSTKPLGYETIIATQTVEGITFNLHSAKNENDQSVLTWVAANTTEKFHGDLFPLVEYVLTTDGENFPNTSDYLGYVGLGTEALHAKEEVTFHVPQLSIDIESKKK